MFLKFVREYFFPAQHMHKILYLEMGSSSLGKSVRPYSSNFPETSASEVCPLLWYILWIFWAQVSGHVWWAQVYSICGDICRVKESVERKKPDSSINFGEAAIQTGFSQHFPERSPVMLPSGVCWEVFPDPEQPYSHPCLIWNEIVKEIGLKAAC